MRLALISPWDVAKMEEFFPPIGLFQGMNFLSNFIRQRAKREILFAAGALEKEIFGYYFFWSALHTLLNRGVKIELVARAEPEWFRRRFPDLASRLPIRVVEGAHRQFLVIDRDSLALFHRARTDELPSLYLIEGSRGWAQEYVRQFNDMEAA